MALTQVDGGLLSPTNAQYTGFKNRLFNGSMQVWQRGTSQSSSGYGSADRWYNVCAGTTTISQDSSVPTGVNLQYSMKWVTGASSSYGQFYQAMEQNNVIPLRGATVTVSMYVKTANYGAGNLILRVSYSNTSDSYASSSAGTILKDTIFTGSTTTTWTRVTGTFTVPADAVGLCVILLPDTVQGSGVSVYMTGAQLELGSTATSFDYRPYGTELALCQRYYIRFPIAYWGVGLADAGSTWAVMVNLPVPMRSQPSLTNSADTSGIAANGLLYNLNAASASIPNSWWNGSSMDVVVTTTAQITQYTIAAGRIANLQCNSEL